ncbi:hypothetical protein HYU07_07610 [Candidatus Woesearchaeota archaeon]|nr:hypothetical protein [Candidatus Woesearchaeota archaeon]
MGKDYFGDLGTVLVVVSILAIGGISAAAMRAGIDYAQFEKHQGYERNLSVTSLVEAKNQYETPQKQELADLLKN